MLNLVMMKIHISKYKFGVHIILSIHSCEPFDLKYDIFPIGLLVALESTHD
jgi:hypothetical protein